MCTVSLIRPLAGDSIAPGWPEGLRLRVVVTRDELRQRAAGQAPVVREADGRRFVMPVDPEGSGTWVAVNDAGLAFALLNGPDGPGPAGDRIVPPSRGTIIPRLASTASADEVLERLQALDLRAYRPWRLIVAGSGRLLDVTAMASGRLRHLKSLLPSRFVATSSRVLHAEAVRERTRLFREIVAPVDPRKQDAFHAHRWPDRRDISVTMSRPEACSVSRTVLEVTLVEVRVSYQSLAPVGSIARAGVPVAGPDFALGAA